MFVASFEKGETDAIIGGPPNPEQDNEENVISVFVSRVIDPDNPFKTSVRRISELLRCTVYFELTLPVYVVTSDQLIIHESRRFFLYLKQ